MMHKREDFSWWLHYKSAGVGNCGMAVRDNRQQMKGKSIGFLTGNKMVSSLILILILIHVPICVGIPVFQYIPLKGITLYIRLSWRIRGGLRASRTPRMRIG